MWAWLQGILKALGFIDDVVKEIHDANQRAAGKNEVVAADLKAANDFAQKALEAANNTDSASVDRSLRNGNF